MSADFTLVRLGVAMRPLVSGHCRSCVSAKATSVTHEGSFIRMFESHVFVKRSLLYSGIIAIGTMKSNKRLLLFRTRK